MQFEKLMMCGDTEVRVVAEHEGYAWVRRAAGGKQWVTTTSALRPLRRAAWVNLFDDGSRKSYFIAHAYATQEAADEHCMSNGHARVGGRAYRVEIDD